MSETVSQPPDPGVLPEPTRAALAEARERTWPWHMSTLLKLALVGTTGSAIVGSLVSWVASSELGAEPDLAAAAVSWGTLGAVVGGLTSVLIMSFAFAWHANRDDIRLVEAASPLHPLLKELMVRAPGTYAHSVAVANLAESGAQRIGADTLTVRVGAYYHDVGKIRRPCFFFENQGGDDNPHETTKPKMSTAIITSHVEDGLELAEQYDLPESVREIIREHHGTSLVRYFFHKAAQSDAGVFEADYRYRGVRPQSPEAAIVMLADSCEAAVRALNQPDPARVEETVRSIFSDKAGDGQLDDSDLSFEQREILISTFTRQLVGLCHVRCEYPAVPSGGADCADQCSEQA